METLKNIYIINGQNFICNLKEPSLEKLIETFLNKTIMSQSNIAVAVNNKVVEKRNWKKKKIYFKDRVEIVAPFFGG